MPSNPFLYRLVLILVLLLVVLIGIAVRRGMRDAGQDKRVLLSPSRQRKKWRLVFFVCLLMLSVLCYSHLHARTGSIGYLLLFYIPLILLSAYMAFRPRTDREDLQNWVCDPQHCGRCGYDLTGNVSGICPECGTPIPDSPKQIQKPWWGEWSVQWHIDYLDNWRKTLAFTAVMAIFCASLALWIAIRGHEWAVMAGVPGFFSVYMAINCIRIVQYRRRIGGR
jgi:hypothetical protein